MNNSFLNRINYYIKFANKNPNIFKNNLGGVRIIYDLDKIYAAEQAARVQHNLLGLPPEGSNVGIISEDPWVTVIRDAVQFPDGDIRLHTRVLNRVNHGVATLPMINNKIVLIRHFRHALRESILEIPRGAIDESSSIEETARQELLEEISGVAGPLFPLGFTYGSTNLFANGSHLFFTKLHSIGEPQIDEGVEEIKLFSINEFEKLMLSGEITEAFTIAAFCQARLRNLI